MSFLEVVGAFALGVGTVAVIGFVFMWLLAKAMGMPDE